MVDDSEDDILLVRKALEKGGVPNPVYCLRSGDEAISYLLGEGRFSNRAEYPLPELVLLDLKMPGTDGFEVLRWIRKQPGLGSMRVVVLSASNQMRDVNQAYQLGANSFMVKPMDFENFVELGKSLQSHWLHHSKAPETFRESKARSVKDLDSGRGFRETES